MKIAMMTNNYLPFVGGVPISVERLAKGLRMRGHEVCIFAPGYGNDRDEGDVIRIRVSGKRLANGMPIPDIRDRRIGEEFRRRNFDLIHVHQPMLMGDLALHMGRKYQIPVVYTYHTQYEAYLHHVPFLEGKKYAIELVKSAVPYYMAHFMKRCSTVFAPTAEIGEYLKSQGVSPVCVLPTGLDETAYLREEKCAEDIRKRYGNQKKYLLCTVSRLEQEKNLYFLLRGAAELQKLTGDCFQLLIIGEGSEKEGLQEYAGKIGIADAVTFVGAVPNREVKNYLFASDQFLFASKSETQGIVLAEAMAAGLPVTALRACGTRDIVKDGVNGYLTEEAEEDFALRAAEILEDSRLRQRMGEAAAATADRYRAVQVSFAAQQAYQRALLEKEESCETVKSHFLRLFKTS